MRWSRGEFRLVGNWMGLADREVLETIALAFRRRLAMDDRAVAYRRRIRIRGRGTCRGVGLAISVFRRWKLMQPSYRRPEARA